GFDSGVALLPLLSHHVGHDRTLCILERDNKTPLAVGLGIPFPPIQRNLVVLPDLPDHSWGLRSPPWLNGGCAVKLQVKIGQVGRAQQFRPGARSEEHTSELQSRENLV